jgi:hypothetical protein
MYEVEFLDGSVEKYMTNLITESLHSQLDDDGVRQPVYHEFLDHHNDGTAIDASQGTTLLLSGHRKHKCTTRGWEILVQHADGSTTWVPLSTVKDANCIQLAEYAALNWLLDEPAFAWWAPFVLE